MRFLHITLNKETKEKKYFLITVNGSVANWLPLTEKEYDVFSESYITI